MNRGGVQGWEFFGVRNFFLHHYFKDHLLIYLVIKDVEDWRMLDMSVEGVSGSNWFKCLHDVIKSNVHWWNDRESAFFQFFFFSIDQVSVHIHNWFELSMQMSTKKYFVVRSVHIDLQ